jgi:hypothetical protein
VTATGLRPGLVARLAKEPDVISTRLEPDGRLVLDLVEGTSTAPLIRTLVENGAEVSEARITSASLEESFLALLGEDDQADRKVEA